MHAPTRSTAALAAATVLVAGCAGTGPGPLGERYQTPIPEGSTLVLEQDLQVPSGEARVFMQNGRVMRDAVLGGMDRFKPRCSFGLERRGSERLVSTIEADRFTTGPARTRAYVRNWPDEGVQVAGRSLSFGFGLAMNDSGGPDIGYLTYVLEIPVSSPDQPQVDDFTCKVDKPKNWRGKLGLEAIREAAGDLVTVERAESGAGDDSGY